MAHIPSTPETPSHSRMATWNHCLRKYYYVYNKGIQKVWRENPFLLAGSVLHKALDALYMDGWNTDVDDLIEKAWDGAVFGGDFDYFTKGHMLYILDHYIRRWREEEWMEPLRIRRSDLNTDALIETNAEEDDEGFLRLGEASFVVDTKEAGPLIVVGDMLAGWSGHGKLYVVDHKTTSSYLANVRHEVAATHQLRQYVLAWKNLLPDPPGGFHWGGAVVNAIHTGKPYTDRKKGGWRSRFDRWTFEYTKDDLDNTVRWIEDYRELHPIVNVFPQNRGRHCKWCEYDALCSSSGAVRSMIEAREYQKKESR